MQKIIPILLLYTFFFTSVSRAEDLATCGATEGYTYYPVGGGMVNKERSGWHKDELSDTSGEVTSLESTENGFDILFVDATKTITSEKSEGGKVILLSHSKDDAIFLVNYSASGVTEVYRFFVESDGKMKYSVSTTRSSRTLIPKSGLAVGDCSLIDFLNIK